MITIQDLTRLGLPVPGHLNKNGNAFKHSRHRAEWAKSLEEYQLDIFLDYLAEQCYEMGVRDGITQELTAHLEQVSVREIPDLL